MQENQLLFILLVGVALGVLIGYFFTKIVFMNKLKGQRKVAIQKSRSVILGQVSEQIAPLLPKFPYNYKDVMFLGKGVDYIVFDGLSEGYVKNIILLEVKTGRANLNRNERLIKNAVENKNIFYDVFRI